MSATATVQIKLTDSERSKIRRSRERAGYIALADFGPGVRIMRSEVFVTLDAAERWTEKTEEDSTASKFGTRRRYVYVQGTHIVKVDKNGVELERVR